MDRSSPHFKGWVTKVLLQVNFNATTSRTFEPSQYDDQDFQGEFGDQFGDRFTRDCQGIKQSKAYCNTAHLYGDHLLYCERGCHRIRRHDAQVRLLAGDLAKAARHPIVEERPLGRHRERPDIRALGRTGGTDLFDVTICPPLSQARIRDAVQNPLNILKRFFFLFD